MKKLMSLLLAFIMVLGVLPLNLLAAETELEPDLEQISETKPESVPETEDTEESTEASVTETEESMKETVRVFFLCEPADLTLTLFREKDGAMETVAPVETHVYDLTAGMYSYRAVCDGYLPEEGTNLSITPDTTEIAVILEPVEEPETGTLPEETVLETEQKTDTPAQSPAAEGTADIPAAGASLKSVPLNGSFFPDPVLLSILKEKTYDQDQDGELTEKELMCVRDLDLCNKKISSLEGIQYFTELRSLNLNGNPISSLQHIQMLERLESFSCKWVPAATLNVSGLRRLEYLDVSECKKMTKLVLGSTPALLSVAADNTPIAVLELQGHSRMQNLSLVGTKIKVLDLAGLSGLKTLTLNASSLTEIRNLQQASGLQKLSAGNCELKELNLYGCQQLTEVTLQNNQLSSLNLSGLKLLKKLKVDNNKLHKLDLSDCKELDYLTFSFNPLFSLHLDAQKDNMSTVYGENCVAYVNSPVISTANYTDLFDPARVSNVKGGIFDGQQFELDPFPEIDDEEFYTLTYDYDAGHGIIIPLTIQYEEKGLIRKGTKSSWHYIYINEDGTYAEDCFKQIDGGTIYLDQIGSSVKGWVEIEKNTYFFNDDYLMVTGWIPRMKDVGYLQADGKLARGWTEIEGLQYYFDENGVICRNQDIDGKHLDAEGVWDPNFGKDCWINNQKGWRYHLAAGTFVSDDWKQIGGRWYYFDTEGYMLTEWAEIGGKVYYFGQDGAMRRGWQKFSQEYCYFDGTGSLVIGWKQIGGAYYYFDSNGFMAAGWRNISGKRYYFGTDGAMVTGWQHIDGEDYYFDARGALARSSWIGDRYVGADGAWDPSVTNCAQWKQAGRRWWYRHADGSYTRNAFEKIGSYWYYFDSQGYMVTGWKLLGGKYYYFERSGHMSVGWRLLDGKYYYFEGSGIMTTGWRHLGGKDYYFYPNGAMAADTWIGSYYVGTDGAWIPGAAKPHSK